MTDRMSRSEAVFHAHALSAREDVAKGLYGAHRLAEGIEQTKPWSKLAYEEQQPYRERAEKVLGDAPGEEIV